jgi:hypothetical protein
VYRLRRLRAGLPVQCGADGRTGYNQRITALVALAPYQALDPIDYPT